jgi:peptidoglycan hydrolase CwlO-like protein
MRFIARIPTTPQALVSTSAIVGVLLATNLTSAGVGDLQSQISTGRSAVASLQSAIAADTARIRTTTNGLNQASGQLDTLRAELAAREARLRGVQGQLRAARAHLRQLENRLRLATKALAANLVARYENGPPDLMTVLLESHGFSDLLEQVNFLKRIGQQDAVVTAAVRRARAEVARQADALASLERRDRGLADEVLARRNQVAALRVALLRRQIAELGARSAKTSKLHVLNAHLTSLEARAAAQARRAAAAENAAVGAAASATAGVSFPSAQALAGGPVEKAHINPDGTATAPADAPPAVKAVIAAANQIIDKPYIYAGGHASWIAPGYDCSGAVSYALHGGGLLSAPLAVQFEGYGSPGPGRWITVFANSAHVFAAIAGLAFDTADFGGPNIPAGSGPRWRYDPTGNLADGGSYVVRHPPEL